jgi:hypothetical protein
VNGAHPVTAPEAIVALVVPVGGVVRLARVPLSYSHRHDGPGPVLTGSWPQQVKWVDTIGACRYVWCGERRRVDDLPANPAAFALAARLGCEDLADRIGLRGDLILAGVDAHTGASDVPAPVVGAAARAGLLPAEAAPSAPSTACVGGLVELFDVGALR